MNKITKQNTLLTPLVLSVLGLWFVLVALYVVFARTKSWQAIREDYVPRENSKKIDLANATWATVNQSNWGLSFEYPEIEQLTYHEINDESGALAEINIKQGAATIFSIEVLPQTRIIDELKVRSEEWSNITQYEMADFDAYQGTRSEALGDKRMMIVQRGEDAVVFEILDKEIGERIWQTVNVSE